MPTSAKINYLRFFLLSAALLVAEYFLARNFDELKVMLTIFLAVCLNQWMLVRAVEIMVKSQTGEQPSDDATSPIWYFLGKVIVLIVALTFGVQIMGKRIIIPVLIYVLQIIVLYLSFEKPGMEQGSNK